MSYRLVFLASAMREWEKLDPDIRQQFKSKLTARLEAPRVASDRLRTVKDCYKIRLRSAGYRLVYQVREQEIIVAVVAVGKRDRNAVYRVAANRL
ncbi:MAG: type II toxin-antitoxin system RelE/ParE family toxin [Gammaproteobacteria bacterium]|nr:type II toxin-antitoxin system RelE/ParE family toxin [Gammaproteobacteria bacterium]MYF49317.1 type II toxin-antitoxin system RelE/ParE family toxin [Gammaproteobacteria bacterium]MYG12962.1 type II toxin-antitoxin system RelE/ParE family toxin [Gammaproteobacteria bacterium]MYK27805.1 type II toxin-antitoxin system RelE/ParE family toxin [Gammaproteobacteria bacterium]